jgi:hypothetical protein
MTEHQQRGKRENTMTDKPNERPIAEKPAVRIEIHAAPKRDGKHSVAVTATNGTSACQISS